MAINLETTEANFCSVTVATLELCQQIKYVLCSRTTERSQTHTHSIITHITLLLTATAKRTRIAGSPKFSSSCSGRELVLAGDVEEFTVQMYYLVTKENSTIFSDYVNHKQNSQQYYKAQNRVLVKNLSHTWTTPRLSISYQLLLYKKLHTKPVVPLFSRLQL